jgi:hypothetical protein
MQIFLIALIINLLFIAESLSENDEKHVPTPRRIKVEE